ncbi:hypothetical protein WKV44_01975 [Spirochaetia bacterium 38H-sp]|uniref:Uncharacterized protein n=1 Tax=Rarispira pelagica TaxID=3141764 RepID=A0ABU9U9F8_9SPIR
MLAILIGFVLIAFGLYFVLPLSWTLNWWSDFLILLKGGIPFFLFFIGLIAIMVGIADIKDRATAKKLEKNKDK